MLAALVAEEFFANGAHAEAKRYFDKIASAYRRERWIKLLRFALERALACAFELGDADAFTRYAFELMALAPQPTGGGGGGPSTSSARAAALCRYACGGGGGGGGGGAADFQFCKTLKSFTNRNVYILRKI